MMDHTTRRLCKAIERLACSTHGEELRALATSRRSAHMSKTASDGGDAALARRLDKLQHDVEQLKRSVLPSWRTSAPQTSLGPLIADTITHDRPLYKSH